MTYQEDGGWEGVVGCGCFVLMALLGAVLFGIGFSIGQRLVS